MNTEHWIVKRLKKTLQNMMTLAFWTWAAVFIALLTNKQPLDLNFYLFTAAVIGIKTFGSGILRQARQSFDKRRMTQEAHDDAENDQTEGEE